MLLKNQLETTWKISWIHLSHHPGITLEILRETKQKSGKISATAEIRMGIFANISPIRYSHRKFAHFNFACFIYLTSSWKNIILFFNNEAAPSFWYLFTKLHGIRRPYFVTFAALRTLCIASAPVCCH